MRNLTDGVGLDGPSIMPQVRQQIVAKFIASYLPRDSIQRRSTRLTLISWYKDLPCSLGRSAILDAALSALSLVFLGRMFDDIRLLHEGGKLRSFVLAKISQLRLPEHDATRDDLIAVAMTMSLYEVRDQAQSTDNYTS
jgi:hypothetical protein